MVGRALCVRGDHPRSRGVYSAPWVIGAGLGGSSPLARGLRSAMTAVIGMPRIIPARAGFTGREEGDGTRVGDHPRSRGVYVSFSRSCFVCSGSSPLARGLRAPQGPDGGCMSGEWQGSSPLARGLRSTRERVPRDLRIIPARAGFTGRAPSIRGAPGDHPRSRGVYGSPGPCTMGPGGSSPLARGLPYGGLATFEVTGIIPARAGFTPQEPSRGGTRLDHPRSRGVYGTRMGRHVVAKGSSPLARGLPYGGLATFEVTGIIPARAGFTRMSTDAWPQVTDHPRSRGVYARFVRLFDRARGSSPLARGLPPRDLASLTRRRIIPARAGFTLWPAGWSIRWRDHPRSRGVYAISPARDAEHSGSSPLARGLRGPVRGALPVDGIIPARAGFTLPVRRGLAGAPDHPRSRGVYSARLRRTSR